MAFIAPIIAAAVGAGAIGTALISAGISLALGYAARALAPKSKIASGSNVGHRLTLRIDPDAPREILVGTAATAGTLAYHHVYGPNGNDNLQMIFALADCECDSLVGIYVDGEPVTWDSSTGDIAEFSGKLNVRFKRGASSDTVPAAFLANSDGRIAATDIGLGVAAVYVTATFDETLFPRGEPRMLFVVKGARLYDIRKDSTAGGSGAHRWGQPATYEWTDNAAVVTYNFRRGIWTAGQHVAGMNTPSSALPAASWIASANACDELVSLVGGGTEKRYRINGVFAVPLVHREVLQDMLAASAGREIDSGGTFKLLPGVSQASVMSIADTDLMADADIEILPKRSRNELINGVFGSYSDPEQAFETVALPPRLSPDDELIDGGVRLTEHYALEMVTSATQGQRVLEILRRRARYQMIVRCRLRSRFCVLEPGDWVTWTSTRYGWTTRVFEVASIALGEDLQASVTLVETAASIYAWTTADEIDALVPEPLPEGGGTFTTVQGVAVATVTVAGGDGATRPGLAATWTPITDSSVDQMRIEYRKAGDTLALERIVIDAAAGQYTWVDGVQGGVVYEVRALPVPRPERAVTWSGWVSTVAETGGQVVASAVLAETVPPGSIGTDELDAQTRFEIALTTALGSVAGSVNERLAAIDERFERIASAIDLNFDVADTTNTRITTTQRTIVTERTALVEQITTAVAALQIDIDTRATTTYVDSIELRVDATESGLTSQGLAITGLQSTIDDPTTGLSATATAVSGLSTQVNDPTTGLATRASASALTTVATTLDGVESSVSQMLEAVGGNLQYNVVLSSAGKWVGWISMDGSLQGTTLDIGASLFRVFDPTVGGGAPVQMLAVQTIDGTPRLTIDGAIMARSIEANTIAATKGSIGVLTGLTGTFVFNSDTGYWGTAVAGVADGVNYLNMATGAWRMGG